MKLISLTFSLILVIISYPQDSEGIRKINGTNMFVSVKGKGQPLVVLHGGPGLNHSYFKPHLTNLEKSFRVIYYDQRACGQSSTPSPDSISLKFLAEDLEALRKELKIEKINLLAHSWGAVLAVHYTLAYPKNVGKIIFSNPAMLSREYDKEAAALIQKKTTKEDSTSRARIIAAGNLNTKKYDQLMHISFGISAYDKANMEKLSLNLPAHFASANRALFTGLMKDPNQGANLYDSLRSFIFPVLIIHGEADITPIASIERLKNNLPQAELVVFKQSGHFPFVEEPGKYTSAVSTFLNKKNN